MALIHFTQILNYDIEIVPEMMTTGPNFDYGRLLSRGPWPPGRSADGARPCPVVQ